MMQTGTGFSRTGLISSVAGAAASTAFAAEPLAPGHAKLLEQSTLAVSQLGFRPGSPSFRERGIFQIEIEFQASVPFAIDEDIYRGLTRDYLNYLYCQRSGYAIAATSPAPATSA